MFLKRLHCDAALKCEVAQCTEDYWSQAKHFKDRRDCQISRNRTQNFSKLGEVGVTDQCVIKNFITQMPINDLSETSR